MPKWKLERTVIHAHHAVVVFAATLDQTLRLSWGEAAARPLQQSLQSSQRLAHSRLSSMGQQQPVPWLSK